MTWRRLFWFRLDRYWHGRAVRCGAPGREENILELRAAFGDGKYGPRLDEQPPA